MRRRGFAVVVIACAAAVAAPLDGSAQERAAGGVTIFDERNCPGNANSAKVTIPFSVGVTGLAPFTSAQIYVTDKDSNPEVTYGPATITADGSGNVCLNILAAPAGMWKVDVVEQGSGFTDSKVFEIEGLDLPPVPTTIPTANPLAPAPPPPAPPPPTVDPNAPTTTADPTAPSTTLPETTTTIESTTTTTEAPGPVPPPNRPFRLLPWIFERVVGGLAFEPAPAQTTGGSPAGLPATGRSTAVGGLAFALVGLGGVLLLVARRGGHGHLL